MNAGGRSSRVFVLKNESNKKPESRSQHLNSLEKLVLSMHLLETNCVVAVKELSFFLGQCARANRDDQVTTKTHEVKETKLGNDIKSHQVTL